MTRGTLFVRNALMSYVLRTCLTPKMKQITSIFKLQPQFLLSKALYRPQETPNRVLSQYASVVTASRRSELFSDKWTSGKQCVLQSVRFRSTGGGWGGRGREPNKYSVKLMDFPKTSMPDLVKSFRNKFFSFLIKGYYDTTFTVEDFLDGATQAASAVSNCIAEGNFVDIKGLVSEEAIREIQNNYADLNNQQRLWLRVDPAEVMGRFIYEIGMMFDDDTDQRFVEITVVLHGYHDLQNTPHSVKELYNRMGENPDNFYVCNYRFIREFTKGVEDSWTINKLNHFLPFPPEKEGDPPRY